MKTKFQIIRNNCFMLKYVLKHVPGLVIYNLLMNSYSGFVRSFTDVYIAKYILDSFQQHRSITEVAVFLVAVVCANVLSSIIQGYYDEVFFLKRKEILYQKMHTELFAKARDMELSCYDNPSFYNDFIFSISQSDGKALDVLNTTGEFFRLMTRIVSVLAIIVSIDISGIFVVILSGCISFVIQVWINKKEYALSVEQVPLQRKRDYTSRILYLADYAKEIRLSHVKDKLVDNFSSTNEQLVAKIRSYGRKLVGLQFAEEAGTDILLMQGLYVLYLLYLILVKKSISYGGFMGLYKGTIDLSDSIYYVGSVLASFQKHSLYIDRFRRFLDYKPEMEEGSVPIPAQEITLECKHLSFQYEGADAPVLHDINLKIRPGEKIALVGYNGAGKTTLVKLLMRLYDPTEGSIEINGVDIRSFSLKDYYDCFGVVFQDFKLFAAMISENVMMDKVGPEDEAVIREALEKSDFSGKLDSLREGTSTILTREFSKSGVELSGGEAQKVAIARIFPRNSRIVILDEPSSALDPVTEYYINQSMLKAAGDKAIVYISHRLSTTKMADRILMLEKGSIIEEGTHKQLMEQNGKYAEMFHMQADKYQNA